MMFGMEVDEVSKADIDDAIGEITNMTGGGIKSMLEGSCSLSLPTVIEGASFTVTSLGTEPIHELSYAVEDSWLAVRVLERKDDAAAPAAHEQVARSEEHTSELQSLMRISYAVFRLKKK